MKPVLRWIFQNFSIKLISVGLALLIYLHVATDREQQLAYRVPLRTANLPDSISVMSAVPKDVKVEFRGKGREIYLALLRGARAECDLTGARPGLLRHLFSPRDVRLPVGVNVSVADVLDPETLMVQLDRRLQRRLPVHLVTRPGPAPGPLSAVPESVSVEGPASVLEGLASVPTEPFTPPVGKDHREGVATLRLDSPYLNVTPAQVKVRLGGP